MLLLVAMKLIFSSRALHYSVVRLIFCNLECVHLELSCLCPWCRCVPSAAEENMDSAANSSQMEEHQIIVSKHRSSLHRVHSNPVMSEYTFTSLFEEMVSQQH